MYLIETTPVKTILALHQVLHLDLLFVSFFASTIMSVYSYDYILHNIIHLSNPGDWRHLLTVPPEFHINYEVALTFPELYNQQFFLRGSRFGFHTIIDIQNSLQTEICAEEMQS